MVVVSYHVDAGNCTRASRKATSALKHGTVSPAPIIFLDGSAIKDQNSPLFPREILVLFLGSNHIPNNHNDSSSILSTIGVLFYNVTKFSRDWVGVTFLSYCKLPLHFGSSDTTCTT